MDEPVDFHVGIDPSINSTGICVIDSDGNTAYFIITPRVKSRLKGLLEAVDCPSGVGSLYRALNIYLLEYSKAGTGGKSAYSERETVKTMNFLGIGRALEYILERFVTGNAGVNLEGISYGSARQSSLADLSGLNFILREKIINKGHNLTVISPSGVKKFAAGHGNASKEAVIEAWKGADRPSWEICEKLGIKADDLADAYFIQAHPGE